MKDKKDVSGVFHRIVKAKGGVYGIETITVDKGKITDVSETDPNYPVVTLSKFGKQAFAEASAVYDVEASTK